ncbi:DNA-binding protein [Candidatus Bathyarchaeota archaeon]|nr:MAG: DNA-binding protein [Candidatus Bathyarchaeota archaeon]
MTSPKKPGRRSRLEILYLILKSCEKGASKTQITYDARINFRISMQYLDLLEERNLVQTQQVGDRSIYKLTEKGSRLLHHLEEAVKLLQADSVPPAGDASTEG